MSGRTGIVLNVYTRPDFTRRGYAKQAVEALFADARDLDLSAVELQATDDGYPLYMSVGFVDDQSKYHRMKWFNRWRPLLQAHRQTLHIEHHPVTNTGHFHLQNLC